MLHSARLREDPRTRMVQHEQISNQTPLFSIIIAVYNDWAVLKGCLQSLARQTDEPCFEVIIVDDGSTVTCPRVRSQLQLLLPIDGNPTASLGDSGR